MAQETTPTRVGKSSDFEPGAIALVEINGREIGIIRLQSGELRAVLNYCPHKGAPICKGFIGGVWQSSGPGDLSFDASQDVLVCPWHGFEFSLDFGAGALLEQALALALLSGARSRGRRFRLGLKGRRIALAATLPRIGQTLGLSWQVEGSPWRQPRAFQRRFAPSGSSSNGASGARLAR